MFPTIVAILAGAPLVNSQTIPSCTALGELRDSVGPGACANQFRTDGYFRSA